MLYYNIVYVANLKYVDGYKREIPVVTRLNRNRNQKEKRLFSYNCVVS